MREGVSFFALVAAVEAKEDVEEPVSFGDVDVDVDAICGGLGKGVKRDCKGISFGELFVYVWRS